ncbi:MAG: hypothetical protein LBQ00_00945 [Syntrophobacterales bacterium]|jgi:hypothetical protein|nr:hypothetical protein [Syntrophobacterales bacterium]
MKAERLYIKTAADIITNLYLMVIKTCSLETVIDDEEEKVILEEILVDMLAKNYEQTTRVKERSPRGPKPLGEDEKKMIILKYERV